MEKRKSKSSSRAKPPQPGRSGSLNSPAEEVFFHEVNVGGHHVPNESYQYLKRAFDDMKQKFVSTKNENKRLQEKCNALIRNFKDLGSKLELQEKENESLRKKVELSFQAYDEKYKDNENLKKELQAIKEEEEGSRQAEDRGEEQQDLAVQTGETATQTKESFDPAREENETVDSSTQTLEEKTDEVGCLLPSSPMKLLRNCGLEIVLENGYYFLLLSDRDLLKKWIENETDGKVSVAFEKTPVIERFVQTDIDLIKELIQCEECPQNKTIIIQVKNKIADQAKLIKQYREQHAIMADLLQKKEPKMASSTSVMVQTEGKFYDEQSMDKQVKTQTKYKNMLLKSMHMLEQKSFQLKKELVYQTNFSKRLLVIIHSSVDLPQSFVSTVLNTAQGKSGKMKKVQKPPVSRSVPDNNIPEYSRDFSLPANSSTEPFLSLPVQETDMRLRVKISKPKDPDYDPSLDDEASSVGPAESRSLTSESSASIVPADETRHTLVSSNAEGVLPPTSATGPEQTIGHDDSDEIVVIDENEGGAVGDSGAKECPICYILYTPSTSQQDYEKHVMDHFKDFD